MPFIIPNSVQVSMEAKKQSLFSPNLTKRQKRPQQKISKKVSTKRGAKITAQSLTLDEINVIDLEQQPEQVDLTEDSLTSDDEETFDKLNVECILANLGENVSTTEKTEIDPLSMEATTFLANMKDFEATQQKNFPISEQKSKKLLKTVFEYSHHKTDYSSQQPVVEILGSLDNDSALTDTVLQKRKSPNSTPKSSEKKRKIESKIVPETLDTKSSSSNEKIQETLEISRTSSPLKITEEMKDLESTQALMDLPLTLNHFDSSLESSEEESNNKEKNVEQLNNTVLNKQLSKIPFTVHRELSSQERINKVLEESQDKGEILMIHFLTHQR